MIDAKSRGFYMILFAKANEVIEKRRAGHDVKIDMEGLRSLINEYIKFCDENQIEHSKIDTENVSETELQGFALKELSEFYSKR